MIQYTKVNCSDTTLYKNKDLNYSLEKVFALPEIQEKCNPKKSASLTTAGHPYLLLNTLPGAGPLTTWVLEQMSVPRKVKLVDAWSNRLFPGWTAQGQTHNHQDSHHVDLVGIFYVDVPKKGAELIFVDGDGTREVIQPVAGDLIIHDASIHHTVGDHRERMVRTVCVFDTVYID